GVEPSLTLGAERVRLLAPGRTRPRRSLAAEGLEERLARGLSVGLDAQAHRIVAADVAALDVDLDDRGLGPQVAVVELRGELSEPRADGDHQVGPAAGGGRLGRSRATKRTEVQGVRVGYRVVSPVRGDHRKGATFAQLDDEIVGAGAGHATADEQQRALGLLQELDHLANRVRMRELRMRRAIVA